MSARIEKEQQKITESQFPLLKKNDPTLQEITWVFEELTDANISPFTTALKTNTHVQKFSLPFNQIGPDGAKYLSDALKGHPSVKELDLDGNCLEDNGVTNLLRYDLPLLFLGLSANGITDAGALTFSQNIPRLLTKVDLSSNQIGSAGAEAISQLLKTNFTLKELNLYHNKIGDEGFSKLAEALPMNSSLRVLNVSANPVSSIGLQTLFSGIKQNTSLTELDVSLNPFDIEALGCLVSALKTHRSLHHLILKRAKLNDSHILQVRSLLKNRSLTALDLSHNDFGPSSAMAIARELERSTTLLELNMHHNPLKMEGLAYLAFSLENNRWLTTLYIDDKQIPYDANMFDFPFEHNNHTLSSINLTTTHLTSKIQEGLKENKALFEKALEACRNGDETTLHQCLEMKINPIALEPETGNTLLHICAQEGHLSLVQVLCSRMKQLKQPFNLLNSEGLTAYDLAKKKEHANICKHLQTYLFEVTDFDPDALGLKDYAYIYNAQIEALEKERLQFEAGLLNVLEPLSEYVLQLGRDYEIIELQRGLAELVKNSQTPEILHKQLLCKLYEINMKLALTKEALMQFPVFCRQNFEPISPKELEVIINDFKTWLTIEEDLHTNLDISLLGKQEHLSLKTFLELAGQNQNPLVRSFLKKATFPAIEKIWNNLIAPIIDYQLNSLMSTSPDQWPKLLTQLYQKELEYFYDVDIPAQMKEFINSRCPGLPKEERLSLAQRYIEKIWIGERKLVQSFQFPTNKTEFINLEKKLKAQAQLKQEIVIEQNSKQSEIGQKLFSGTNQLKKREDEVRSYLNEFNTQAKQSLLYLATLGTTHEVETLLTEKRAACKEEAKKNFNPPLLHKISSFFDSGKQEKALRAEESKLLADFVNAPNQKGKKPLHAACLYGRADIVNLLLIAGADPGQIVEDDFHNAYTPYHFACYCLKKENLILILNSLYTGNKNVDQTGSFGRTPLHTAALLNNIEAAKWLLKKGANLNARETSGRLNTPLHNAAEKGCVTMVNLLLDNEADRTLVDDKGHTPLMLAILYAIQKETVVGPKGEKAVQFKISPSHLQVVLAFLRKGFWMTKDQIEALKKEESLRPYVTQVIAKALETVQESFNPKKTELTPLEEKKVGKEEITFSHLFTSPHVEFCITKEGLEIIGHCEKFPAHDIDQHLIFWKDLKSFLENPDQRKPEKLNLSHCKALQATTLKSLLYEDLKELNISGCSRIDQKGFEAILQLCPRIEKIIVSADKAEEIKSYEIKKLNKLIVVS